MQIFILCGAYLFKRALTSKYYIPLYVVSKESIILKYAFDSSGIFGLQPLFRDLIKDKIQVKIRLITFGSGAS